LGVGESLLVILMPLLVARGPYCGTGGNIVGLNNDPVSYGRVGRYSVFRIGIKSLIILLN